MLFAPMDPLAETREPCDKVFCLDHFKQKLMLLACGMNTTTARVEALRRHAAMETFLHAFAAERAAEANLQQRNS
jgi:HD superfamily phosphodiesterase